MRNFLKDNIVWVLENFKENTSKMLIATGTLGWILSSLAQAVAIIANPKISDEKKSFLLPQELMDAAVNIGGFILITLFTKKGIEKMAETGKIATESVRKFINSNPEYKARVGKLDFNLDDILKDKPELADIKSSYLSYKNFVTTLGTVGASVISCNMVTPLIRNATASRVQKTYIDMKKNPSVYQYQSSGNMKV